MKTEKELKEDKEFDELIKKGKKMDKIEFLRLIFLSGCDVGKRQRNAEVKKVIEDVCNFSAKNRNGLDIKEELLQKLGLEDRK